MKSSLMHHVGKLVWVLTALAAIAAGAAAFGYNFYETRFLMDRPQLVMILQYVLLASGVISLAMLAMACTSGCCSSCNGTK